jgi:hypothetical protein
MGEVSKKVKKSELNGFQARWLHFPLRRRLVLAAIEKVGFWLALRCLSLC